MDNNLTQNNQTDAGWQNTEQQNEYQQGMNQNGMFQQNMMQPNVYQQSMMQQGMYQQNTYQQNTYQQNPYQQNMYAQGNQIRLTRKEFIDLPEMHDIKQKVIAGIFLLYFVAGINFLLGINYFTDYIGYVAPRIFIDVAFIFLTALFLQLTYSKIFGILALGYGILNMIVFLVNIGKPGGVLIIIAGILVAPATFKFDKAWKEYIKAERR